MARLGQSAEPPKKPYRAFLSLLRGTMDDIWPLVCASPSPRAACPALHPFGAPVRLSPPLGLLIAPGRPGGRAIKQAGPLPSFAVLKPGRAPLPRGLLPRTPLLDRPSSVGALVATHSHPSSTRPAATWAKGGKAQEEQGTTRIRSLRGAHSTATEFAPAASSRPPHGAGWVGLWPQAT